MNVACGEPVAPKWSLCACDGAKWGADYRHYVMVGAMRTFHDLARMLPWSPLEATSY